MFNTASVCTLLCVLFMLWRIVRPHWCLHCARQLKQQLRDQQQMLELIVRNLDLARRGLMRVHVPQLEESREAMEFCIGLEREKYRTLMDIAIRRFCFYRDICARIAMNTSHEWIANIALRISSWSEAQIHTTIRAAT